MAKAGATLLVIAGQDDRLAIGVVLVVVSLPSADAGKILPLLDRCAELIRGVRDG
jgi:hypothetical protein